MAACFSGVAPRYSVGIRNGVTMVGKKKWIWAAVLAAMALFMYASAFLNLGL